MNHFAKVTQQSWGSRAISLSPGDFFPQGQTWGDRVICTKSHLMSQELCLFCEREQGETYDPWVIFAFFKKKSSELK